MSISLLEHSWSSRLAQIVPEFDPNAVSALNKPEREFPVVFVGAVLFLLCFSVLGFFVTKRKRKSRRYKA